MAFQHVYRLAFIADKTIEDRVATVGIGLVQQLSLQIAVSNKP